MNEWQAEDNRDVEACRNRAFLDELRFAKQQQWTVTNYTLLLMGAVYGLAKVTGKSPTTFCERVAWSAVMVWSWALVSSSSLTLRGTLGSLAPAKGTWRRNLSPKTGSSLGVNGACRSGSSSQCCAVS